MRNLDEKSMVEYDGHGYLEYDGHGYLTGYK